MTWVRIESGFLRHRKIIDLSLNAKMLFLAGLCYAAENSTDGFISHSALRIISAETRVAPRYAADLHRAGLWHKQADGWDIHDYLVYQPSAEQERQRRQVAADRVKSWRETKSRRNASRNGVTDDTSNGVGNAVTTGVRNAPGNGPVTLSPNPNPSSSSSSSTHGCSDQALMTTICEAIADQRIARLAKAPDNPNGYRRKVVADVAADLGPKIATLVAERPELEPAAIAAIVEPPAPARPPDPIERTGAAQRARDERLAAVARGEACKRCDGTGVVEVGDGTYERCDECQG